MRAGIGLHGPYVSGRVGISRKRRVPGWIAAIFLVGVLLLLGPIGWMILGTLVLMCSLMYAGRKVRQARR